MEDTLRITVYDAITVQDGAPTRPQALAGPLSITADGTLVYADPALTWAPAMARAPSFYVHTIAEPQPA